MSDAQKAELTLAILISIIGGGFVAWGAWVALWGIYDHIVGHYKRRRNTRFDVGRAL